MSRSVGMTAATVQQRCAHAEGAMAQDCARRLRLSVCVCVRSVRSGSGGKRKTMNWEGSRAGAVRPTAPLHASRPYGVADAVDAGRRALSAQLTLKSGNAEVWRLERPREALAAHAHAARAPYKIVRRQLRLGIYQEPRAS